MATLVQTQADLAAALTAVTAGTVRTLPVSPAKAGDGWVNIGKITPAATSMTKVDVTFTCVLVLGADARAAAAQLPTLARPLIDAVTTGPFHPDGVSVEPATLPAGDSAPGDLYALILTLNLECD